MAMNGKAVSAQGSKVYISTGLGTAITITAVSKAAQAVVTATNTLAKGDVVQFVTVTGMPELTGVNATVVAATGSSFTVDVDSSGFAAVGTSGSAKPYTFVAGCVTKFSGLDGSATDLDATTLCSTAKEKRVGLTDEGNFSIDFYWSIDDVFQQELRKAKKDRAERVIKVVFHELSTLSFSAFVKTCSIDGSVDSMLTGSSDMAITGEVTYTISA